MPAKKKINTKKTKPVKAKTPKVQAKKPIKKTRVKKPITKKTRVKKSTGNKKLATRRRRKNLIVVWDERCFFVHNGPALGSLADLSCWLSTADPENFKYHLADGRNDFADWIKYVLGDKSCAGKIKKTRTPAGMYKIISRHLKENYV